MCAANSVQIVIAVGECTRMETRGQSKYGLMSFCSLVLHLSIFILFIFLFILGVIAPQVERIG